MWSPSPKRMRTCIRTLLQDGAIQTISTVCINNSSRNFSPSATVAAERLCFYNCLSFCPQEGVWQTPPGQTHPRSRHPPLGRYNPPGQTHPSGQTPPGQTHPLLGRHPPGQTPPFRDGHWSGRYASYWNAFLSVVQPVQCFCLVFRTARNTFVVQPVQ